MAPLPAPSDEVTLLHPKVIILSAGITTSLFIGYKFYKRYLKRVRNYLDLSSDVLDNQRSMYGYVTRVGDGDNFRFYHTPGGLFCGWGWLRKIPTTRSGLKDETLMIRLAGMDAPERLHWGKPAQPFSDEALQWLKEYVNGRYVTITPYLIDQYKRVVARAQVWKWTGKRDISAEMIRHGMAIVYESKVGAEFGGYESWYRKLEQRAKKARKGVWSLLNFTTPGEFKKIYYK